MKSSTPENLTVALTGASGAACARMSAARQKMMRPKRYGNSSSGFAVIGYFV